VLDRPSPNIVFSDEALRANLERLEGEWEIYQCSRDRDAVYGYLNAVFELVSWWEHEGKAVEYARRALRLSRFAVKMTEPFTTVIFCTADSEKVDYRLRSKWSRVLRYTAQYKYSSEPLRDFIKRKGGINKCAARYTRRLGRRS
jgi:hypothetical protein